MPLMGVIKLQCFDSQTNIAPAVLHIHLEFHTLICMKRDTAAAESWREAYGVIAWWKFRQSSNSHR